MGSPVRFFLCGDVMTGRGIDQVMPHSVDPVLHEPYMTSARGYVSLAQKATGPIPQPVDYAYVWGDALEILARERPDIRLVNLETSITQTDDFWPDKGIHYRMHPGNVPCLTAAGIHCCALANNHVLDWGHRGLADTLENLAAAGIGTAGAGTNLAQASAPAALPNGNSRGRTLVFSIGMGSSGIPRSWGATDDEPGIHRLPDLSLHSVAKVGRLVAGHRRPGDLVVVSIHWGGNWGYGIPQDHVDFAHRLIDEAGVDMIHGHSSHHPLGLEIYRGKPVIYGCGDLINDYEGISGHEEFRSDLGLLYLVDIEPGSGRLGRLDLIPMQMRHFRLNRPPDKDRAWLRDVLEREYRRFGSRIRERGDGALTVHWP